MTNPRKVVNFKYSKKYFTSTLNLLESLDSLKVIHLKEILVGNKIKKCIIAIVRDGALKNITRCVINCNDLASVSSIVMIQSLCSSGYIICTGCFEKTSSLISFMTFYFAPLDSNQDFYFMRDLS